MFRKPLKRFNGTACWFTRIMLNNESRTSLLPSGHRFFYVSSCLCAKIQPRKKPREVVEIAGLERITYADRMHFVPGLAKPTFPKWVQDYKNPSQYYSPEQVKMPLYNEKPCYIFNQTTNVLEGVRQALWLTKAKLIKGLPAQLLSLTEDTANTIDNQDERVQNAIKHARLWDTTEDSPRKQRFCSVVLKNLLHLCGSLQVRHPVLKTRIQAEKYRLETCWNRGEDLFQVRGQNGLILNSRSPIPALAGKEEVLSTVNHSLETFYPISPTIDLQRTQVYQEKNHTGFLDDYPYPHAHTIFMLENGDMVKLQPEQLRAKMIMFAFGNALARAHSVTGGEPRVLEHPIVVQAVATNGRLFQFVVFQLNTTDLAPDTGVKNLVWVEEDQLLYEFAMSRPIIKRKVVQIPDGLSGYKPDTFRKFLCLYLHGAV